MIRNLSLKLLVLLNLLALGALPQSLNAKEIPLGAVATQHPLATQAAAEILRKGGNAIDAAVSAALVLAVVEPYNSGLGAGGLAMVWDGKKRKAYAVDFRERAPLKAGADLFTKPGIPADASRNGPLAIGVPGEVLGLANLHLQWGQLTWKKLFSIPIRLAREGFVPDQSLLSRSQERRNCLRRDYDSYKIYRPLWKDDLKVPGQKELVPTKWKQTELAGTLEKIAAKGAEVFYRGSVGRALVGNLKGKGSLITMEDLARYEVVQRDPLDSKFDWGRVYGFPLPSSGGISVLRGLNTMEALEKKHGGNSPWLSWMLRVFAQVFQTRNAEMGDADFVSNLPVKKWIRKGYGRKQAREILKAPSGRQSPRDGTEKTRGQTTHLSVIDAQGNAVAMTLTQNLSFGSCVTAGKTGILMNNQMDDFSTRPGKPNAFGLVQSKANAVAPGKRPLSSMSPTLVTQKRKVVLAIGSPGGPRIITALLQVLYRHFFLGETLSQAIATPRFHYQQIPNKIFLEAAGEAKMGPLLDGQNIPLQVGGVWGNVQAVAYDRSKRDYSAFSDPRAPGAARVVFKKRATVDE